jgi:alpha-glucan phosphorylase-like protein
LPKGDELWSVHLQAKQRLSQYIQQRTGFTFDPNFLVVTWSRRMAGYKRMDAIFSDVARLRALLKSSTRPVQLLLAGKAHVFDVVAKQELEKIIHSMQNELSGNALFIPNLDMELDQMLAQGSDVWLNTPKYGEEASGTSGMKALSNGVLQCTVPDGWAAEVDWKGLGWTLDSDRVAEDLYTKLEQEIAPLFYQRNSQGVPEEWLARMKNSVRAAGKFSATRMMNEYREKLY